jgi:hypothetical protein
MLDKRSAARCRQRSACAAGAAALLAAGPSGALEWSYVPAASVGAQYDSNIRLSFDGGEPVNGRLLTGAADVVGRNEGLEFRVTPRILAQRYDDPSVEDRDYEYADVSISTHNDRQRWSFGGNYALEGTRNSQFESNGFAAVDFDRKQTGVNTNWMRLTERGQYDLAASSTYVDYQESLLSPYRDYRYNVLQGDYYRTTSARSRWGFTVSYAEVTTNRGLISTTSADARATWLHSFSESLQFRVGLGMLDTATSGAVATSSTAPALDFSVTKVWPRWRFGVTGGRQIQPDSQGSLLQEDRVQVDVTRQISQRLSVGLMASKSNTSYFVSFYDRDYWSDSIGVQWRFKRRWLLDGSVTDHGQQYVVLGLPRQTGVVSQFSISYRGG